jgi:hypothetical protein
MIAGLIVLIVIGSALWLIGEARKTPVSDHMDGFKPSEELRKKGGG